MLQNKTLKLALPLLIVLAGAVIYQYGYLQVKTEMEALKESRAVKIRTLEKYTEYILEKPELEKKLAALQEMRKSEDTKLIEGQTPSLAAANLQNTVKGIITERGGTISSERVGKPEDTGNFRVIDITVDAVLPDARALSDILYSIETRTPYLVVKELDTRIRNFRDPKDLMVKLNVSALTTGK
jgi:hypothetical protein